MFYNYGLAGYFILLFVAFVATLNGLTILRTKTFEMPGGSRVDGQSGQRSDKKRSISSISRSAWFVSKMNWAWADPSRTTSSLGPGARSY